MTKKAPIDYISDGIVLMGSRIWSIVTWPYRTFLCLVYWFVGWPTLGKVRSGGVSPASSTSSLTPPTIEENTLRKRRSKGEQLNKLREDMNRVVERLGQVEQNVQELGNGQQTIVNELSSTKRFMETAKSDAKKTRDDIRCMRLELKSSGLKAGLDTPPKRTHSQTSISKQSSSSSTPESSSPPTPVLSRASPSPPQTGPTQVTVKLSNFTRLQASSQAWYSPPFETAKDGHTMCLEVYPNGRNGHGTHLSVYVFIVKGKNDDRLTWPFVGHVVVELLNQIDDSNHVKMDFGEYSAASPRVPDSVEMSNSLGMPQFLSLSELRFKPKQKCQYLRNDTLYLRVTVEVKPPVLEM